MTTTTNYGYTVVVGSDTPVNIQNDIAPNFTAIDTDLKAVSDSAITTAVHTFTGGVHALVRADADRDAMFFTATADMATGDTFTVDGVSVTARLVNGEALKTGSFVINNNVFAILIGSVLNIYATNPVVIPTPTASGTTYDNTQSGLSATNVQDAIDEVASASSAIVDVTSLITQDTVHDQFRAFKLGGFLYVIGNIVASVNNATQILTLPASLLPNESASTNYTGSMSSNGTRSFPSAFRINTAGQVYLVNLEGIAMQSTSYSVMIPLQ